MRTVRVPMTGAGAMYAFPSVKLPPKAIEETAQWSFFFMLLNTLIARAARAFVWASKSK